MESKFLHFKAYINGQYVDHIKHITIVSPLTLKACGKVPALTGNDIDRAFASARNAFSTWQKLPTKSRTAFINDFAMLLRAQKRELAYIMHIECGKGFNAALSEIERALEYIRLSIQMWPTIKHKTDTFQNKKSIQHRIPVGVVLAISSFNYPVNLALSKIVPALLAGNTVVFKAATNGSLVGGFLARIWDKVNLPPGVFNFVTGFGSEIGDLLTQHKAINMIAFTGSVKVGHQIAKMNPLVPKVFELGGNDAAYVRADADLELAATEVSGGAFAFAGQRCTAIKRLIIAQEVEKEFVSKLKTRISELEMEPVINEKAASRLDLLYKEALKADKAEAIIEPQFNSNRITAGLIKTAPSTRLWQEEQFGPILPYVVVDNDEAALKLMNKTAFGLQNCLFTSDSKWAQKVARYIESGTVNINGKSARSPDQFPFLGIKNSGLGVQSIVDTLLAMTRVLNIVINE